MRILYIDIDSLRPDHLGCYGYPRDTSPNIDRVAVAGARFDNVYASDAPCLPSRTALWSGRFGIHNGVINHGGTAAEPFVEGPRRKFVSTLGQTSWMRCLRDLGHRTVTVSPFGERHSAWHWYANFSEIHNTGQRGMERADEIFPVADRWLRDNARDENWFLHVNFWDPHTPYRTPDAFGDPFADAPLPAWLTEDVRQRHWAGVGPHSAREVMGYDDAAWPQWPKQPVRMDSMTEVRRMFNGYDAGVRYADAHVGRLLNTLADQGVHDQTAVIVSADHGENLGELNIYGDHQTADQHTCRVPMIIQWPGVTRAGDVNAALHYQFDFAATMVDLLGGKVPSNWDARPHAAGGRDGGRDFLVISQGAWSCQRSVRFDDADAAWLCVRSYHDGYHGFPDVMLFDLKSDPHEQHDVAPRRPDIVGCAMTLLDRWHGEMMRTASHPADPMWTVLREGGPLHTCGHLTAYVQRLRETGRARWAEELLRKHASECDPADR